MQNESPKTGSPRFALGQVVATPGALKALEQAGEGVQKFLSRHVAGDWGDLDDEDKQLNDEALKDDSRLLSAYTLTGGVRIWIITEAVGDDGKRASTCVLLPEEY